MSIESTKLVYAKVSLSNSFLNAAKTSWAGIMSLSGHLDSISVAKLREFVNLSHVKNLKVFIFDLSKVDDVDALGFIQFVALLQTMEKESKIFKTILSRQILLSNFDTSNQIQFN